MYLVCLPSYHFSQQRFVRGALYERCVCVCEAVGMKLKVIGDSMSGIQMLEVGAALWSGDALCFAACVTTIYLTTVLFAITENSACVCSCSCLSRGGQITCDTQAGVLHHILLVCTFHLTALLNV